MNDTYNMLYTLKLLKNLYDCYANDSYLPWLPNLQSNNFLMPTVVQSFTSF